MSDPQRRQLLYLSLRMGLLPLATLLHDFTDDPQAAQVRANLLGLLASVEDAAGVPRTLPSREERRRVRDVV